MWNKLLLRLNLTTVSHVPVSDAEFVRAEKKKDIPRQRSRMLRPRREFRGDRSQPALIKSLATAWQSSYKQATAGIQATCDAVAARYEHEVNQYGYSLVNLGEVVVPEMLQPYIVD